jgi:tetratricopeptide (TPR) repeat protein
VRTPSDRPPRRRFLALVAATSTTLALHLPLSLLADTITLKSGRVIEAEQAWYEGTELRYRKDGGTYRLPRELVARLDSPTGEAGLDPDVLRSRERLAAQDPGEALRFARLALFRDPASVPALVALARAQLALGDPQRARESAEQAVRANEASPRAHAVLGDALVALGEPEGADQAYRRSLELRPDAEVEQKRKEAGLAGAGSDAQFRIRYEGSVKEPIGMAVLNILTATHREYASRLGFRPEQPIMVVLLTGTSFRDTTRAPDWAEAWNDGTIQVPVLGLDSPHPRLVRVLRHELAHSFVASRTGNNCPVWLHEGIAQWLEGGDPGRDDATLAALARAGQLPNLLTLEGPFRGLSETQATSAYGTSLAAVAYILRLRGEAGLLRLIAALSDRLPSEEALPVSLGVSYSELQRGLVEHLRTADTRAGSPRAAVGP